MLDELKNAPRVVGAKQARRALMDGRARRIYVADNADPRVTEPIAQLGAERGVPVTQVPDMRQLGAACGISVGAAVAVLL